MSLIEKWLNRIGKTLLDLDVTRHLSDLVRDETFLILYNDLGREGTC